MSYTYMNIKDSVYPYRLQNMEVFFSDLSCLDIIKSVLDEKGQIKKFPGLVKDKRWEDIHRIGQCYDVRFEAKFYHMDDEFLMLWMIQPSGWYWVDGDGFGFNGDQSITLYSLIDSKGNFTRKFELFSINNTRYCNDFDRYL